MRVCFLKSNVFPLFIPHYAPQSARHEGTHTKACGNADGILQWRYALCSYSYHRCPRNSNSSTVLVTTNELTLTPTTCNTHKSFWSSWIRAWQSIETISDKAAGASLKPRRPTRIPGKLLICLYKFTLQSTVSLRRWSARLVSSFSGAELNIKRATECREEMLPNRVTAVQRRAFSGAAESPVRQESSPTRIHTGEDPLTRSHTRFSFLARARGKRHDVYCQHFSEKNHSDCYSGRCKPKKKRKKTQQWHGEEARE